MKQDAPALAGRAPPMAEDGTDGTTDEDLMTAYGRGDATAFEVLYARYKGPLYRYFRRQLDEGEAHDCFQTLWLKIVRHRRRYSADAPFRHYLFTLAHNVLMDHHRQTSRRGVTTDAGLDDIADPAANPEGLEERARLSRALRHLIRGLPIHQREAWLLRQESGLSTAEIARVTGASEEGVKSRLRYARDRLKQGMSHHVR